MVSNQLEKNNLKLTIVIQVANIEEETNSQLFIFVLPLFCNKLIFDIFLFSNF
jgi:hypothetical protein